MSIHGRFNQIVKITRRVENSSVSSYDFDDTADIETTVIEQYLCSISEKNVRYEVDKKGDNYSGILVMKGLLTDQIQEGDIVDGQFKVVGKPRQIAGAYIRCNLVRL
ncbi:hypothetical protein BBF96_03500 [Anoxybacter fermentans]|uniref:Uncharacterized protein n=1 Tax=Anoxybacter fermentans TaxID=1323375 RepID=A0A3Q9HPJ8_9FIRM|nr:hypothetical protein [Anoxybacter fermentans]AZR72528.1 hypothetical protein BBF96_03500 [Anoxybacter fermentans]